MGVTVTKFFTWVILVVVLLMAFNGYITTKRFNEYADRSQAQLESFMEYHKAEVARHATLETRMFHLQEDIHKLTEAIMENNKDHKKIVDKLKK